MAARLPILEWLPAYDRRRPEGGHRGRDRGDGTHRPEGPRLRRDCRSAAAERPLRCGRGGDHLRALLHVAPDLHRAELVAGRRGGRRGPRRRPGGRRCCGARHGDHAGLRAAVPRVRSAAARVDIAVPLQGRDHRLPGGRCRRRGDRRAAQADRNGRGRRQRMAGARFVDRLARRRARRDGARGGARSRADPGPALPEACRSWCAGPRRRGDPRGARLRPRRARSRARRRRAKRASGARAAELRPDPGPHRDDRLGGVRAAADRVLADRRGRARVRRAAQVRHRCRSGVGGSGHGERRRGRLPGHAGLDESLGQLAERVGRGRDRRWRRSSPARWSC